MILVDTSVIVAWLDAPFNQRPTPDTRLGRRGFSISHRLTTTLTILVRELRLAARKPGLYWLRVLGGGGLAAVLSAEIVLFGGGVSPADRLRDQTWLGLGLALGMAVAAARSWREERENGLWE